jgi:hypothetical protein
MALSARTAEMPGAWYSVEHSAQVGRKLLLGVSTISPSMQVKERDERPTLEEDPQSCNPLDPDTQPYWHGNASTVAGNLVCLLALSPKEWIPTYHLPMLI